VDKQTIQRILTDAGTQLQRQTDEINADFLLLFYPFPKTIMRTLGQDARMQVERRCTRAVQEEFEKAIKEARRDQFRE
jgi:hypothetical protein